MNADAALITPEGKLSLTRAASRGEKRLPPQYVKVDGREVRDFVIDFHDFHSLEAIRTVHGSGKRLRLWGTAETADGGRLKKTVAVEMYERYPGAALFRTEYANLGLSALPVETCYEVTWRLDPESLWAFHPRNWDPGEDYVFPLEPGMSYDRENCAVNPERYDHPNHGGGLPASKAIAGIRRIASGSGAAPWPRKGRTKISPTGRSPPAPSSSCNRSTTSRSSWPSDSTSRTTRSSRRKGISGARELFDHENDPGEWNNLAESSEHQATLRHLHVLLREVRGQGEQR